MGTRRNIAPTGSTPLLTRHTHTHTQRERARDRWINTLRDLAKLSEKSISYDVKIFDEMAWRRRPFQFDRVAWDPNTMSITLKQKLCLGEQDREYTVIGEAFPFPDREDSPVINNPANCCRLLWDHHSPTEKIMVQLSEHIPPILWITIKPTLAALRKLFSEFLEADTQHMKKYLPYYEEVQNKLESREREKFGEGLSDHALKDQFVEDMRRKDPSTLQFDWTENHTMYVGTSEHFRLVEDRYMKESVFVFGWPLLMGDGNHYLENTPLRVCAFRTIFSKSMVLFHTRLDLQLDHRQCKLEAADEADILLEIPIFVTVNYPKNTRLCGGAALIERFNKVMGTSFPLTMPIDVIATLLRESNNLKGARELREEMLFLKAASEKVPDVERVIRLSPDMLGSSRILGQLSYIIVYLAIVEYDDWVTDVYQRFCSHASDMIRVACAKGAHISQRDDLVDELVKAEAEGRTKRLIARSKAMPSSAVGGSEGVAAPHDTNTT